MSRKPLHARADRRRKARLVIAVLILVMSFVLPWAAAKFEWLGLDPESAIGVFGGCFAAIGTILVVFELNDSERATCCNMISEMNTRFIENERMMHLYQKLCDCIRNPGEYLHVNDNDPEAVHSSDIMAYMTFYEVMNEYLKNGVMTIKQMDDMFGDRFFKLVHNAYVQEYELYAEPSSYVNIFQLYNVWTQYRNNQKKKDSKRLVVNEEYEIPSLYLKKKLYLHETAQFFANEDGITLKNKKGEKKEFSLRRLLPKHFKSVIAFQESVIAGIPETDKDFFAKSEDDEIKESMLIDFCYGLFEGDKLAAVCICVLNRSTRKTSDHQRNLCVWTDTPKEFQKYITFDTIQVALEYTGFGIQRYFLEKAEEVARTVDAKGILATVHPKNTYSRANFEKAGYFMYGGKEIPMYNSTRCLMVKHIAEENSYEQISESCCIS